MGTALIILAAGQGTRMKSDLPKVLHQVGSAPLLAHAMTRAAALAPERTVIVTGHGAEAVARAAHAVDPGAEIVHQERRLGTAHAAAQARPALAGSDGDAVVLYGDTPFISGQTLARMSAARREGADLVVLGFETADPGTARYGRLIGDANGLDRIVEWTDATHEERAVTLCNSGVVMAHARRLFGWIDRVGNHNANGEYYLTDIVALARADGCAAVVVTCDEAETLGVNSRAELALAEATFQAHARAAAMANGVTLTAPETVFFALDTVIGRDAVIEPHVVFGPGVSVGSGARIRSFTHLEGARIAGGAIVGPFARLRPGAALGSDVHIGNFVEIKNATIDAGAKINHLSYVGDASVGAGSNIGAGTITCNYDGVMKHRTEIGRRAFIGSNTMLVAPVRLGDEAMTGAGSVITADVPEGALAVSRVPQVTRPGLAARLMVKLRAAKARNEGK